MADKHTSDVDSESRRDIPATRQPDPDDDVTSELSGLIARAFGSDDGRSKDDTRITSARLVPHRRVADEDTLEPGFLLSERFEIIELVHSGGMSHVYKAIDRRRHPGHSQQTHVAVKMLRRSLSDHDEYRLLLEKEASKARSLSHPNIIKIFDFDAHDGQFFLVMEWLEGDSLKTLLKRTSGEPLSPTFAWAVVEAVADALQHSHSNGVIHADINPSNIFVTTTHDIKLLDFGVARYADDDEEKTPEDMTAWVTPSYASPEVLSGSSPLVQDDLFSLACVAYRCFAGAHPFDGKLSIVAQREGIEVKPITVLSEEEWSALQQSLSYTRAERPDSTSVLLRGHAAANAIAPAESTAGPWPWAMLAAATVAAILVIGWWSQSGTSPEDGAPAVATGVGDASPTAVNAAVDAAPSEPVAVVDSLLVLARQAVSAEQLVLPANNNARDWYRQALAIDANNAEALAGLRAISDTFIEEARTAIEAGDPRAAESALAAAAETDAGNPATAMLEDLLVTYGDAQLTAARLAAADGNIEQAAAALAQAEQYSHIEAEAIESIRTQLTTLDRNEALRNDLAVVDAHIAAGRLLEPAGENAYESLVPLRDAYGTDPALNDASRRLADRLLTRAALASASANPAQAESLVSAAASLGVLDEEVERVRAVISTAAAANGVTTAAPAVNTVEPSIDVPDASAEPQPVGGVTDTAVESLAVASASDSAVPDGVDPSTANTLEENVSPAALLDRTESTETGSMPALPTEEGNRVTDVEYIDVANLPAAISRGLVTEAELPLAGSEPAPAAAETGAAEPPAAAMATATKPVERTAQSTALQLQDLGITKYSSPKYPQGAKRRGLSGYVDVAFNVTPDGRTDAIEILGGEPAGVFERSATRAIRQWRFEPREETVRGSITLRFEIGE